VSNSPISLSDDLSRLKAEGFELEIVANHLVVRNAPYVNAAKQVRRGSLVSTLNMAGNVTRPPDTHFISSCNRPGNFLLNQPQESGVTGPATADTCDVGLPDHVETFGARELSQGVALDLDAETRAALS
jgi:hypothetical protein